MAPKTRKAPAAAGLKLVEYIGPHDAVDGPGFVGCKRGHTVEVPADVAAGLLEQVDNWRETDTPNPTPDDEAVVDEVDEPLTPDNTVED